MGIDTELQGTEVEYSGEKVFVSQADLDIGITVEYLNSNHSSKLVCLNKKDVEEGETVYHRHRYPELYNKIKELLLKGAFTAEGFHEETSPFRRTPRAAPASVEEMFTKTSDCAFE